MGMTEQQQRVLRLVAAAGDVWDGPWPFDDPASQCIDRGWLQREGSGYALTHSGRRALEILSRPA